MEKISIVSTIYNKAPWLERFFDTVLNQTYQNLEVVAVNNASTDDSMKIIEKYALKDSRIKVIQVKVNNGPANGFRVGIDAVEGEFFTIVDADDYIDSDYIEKLYTAIKSEEADVAMCLSDLVWDNGKNLHKRWPPKEKYIIEGEEVKKLPMQLLDELNNQYLGFYMPEIGATWAKLYKTSFIRQNNIKFEKNLWIWCDFVFNLSVFKHVKKMVYITTTCYHFYQSEGSVTRSKDYKQDYAEKVLLAMNKIYEGCLDIKSCELEKASNRFYFNRIKDVVGYYIHYYPKFVSSEVLDYTIHSMLTSLGGNQLYASKDFPNKSLEDKIYLYGYYHSKAIMAHKINIMLRFVRRYVMSFYRVIFTNTDNNVLL